jgi:hypothetical protein
MAMALLSPVQSALTVPNYERELTPRDARMLTVLLVGRIIRPNGDGLCRIRNISAGGLMAEVCARFMVEERVTIELRNDRMLEGVVRWIKPGKIGVQFDQPLTDIAQILSEQRLGQRRRGGPARRSPRLPTDCSADIQLDGHHFHGAVTDVSQHGARLVTSAPVRIDRLLRLTVAGLPPLRGTVRWLTEDGAGITFLDPIAFTLLGEWLEKPELRYNRHEVA